MSSKSEDTSNIGDVEEIDELDAFMNGIHKELELQEKDKAENSAPKGIREDIEEMDDQETYFKYIKESVIIQNEDDDQFEYDSDGNVINTFLKREILPLPPLNHSEIKYPPFQSNFYIEHEEVKKLTPELVEKYRKDLGINVSGLDPPRPSFSFAHFMFDKNLMNVIRQHNYHTPTPIQSQAIPVALSGRDVIGIAQTGSGKTAAYLLPMMVHTIDQPELQEGDGPIALVCAPTRELCQQIHSEAIKFAMAYNLTVAACFGGANKHKQELALKQGTEILIATPGRLIDLIKDKATNLHRVTFLVFDEADRMFELGFETQVRSIANNVRPDRQCLLFSATFKKKIENLCREILTDPIRIVIGEIGEASENVTQIVNVLKSQKEKTEWLLSNIVKFSSTGSVLIFVTKKENCVEVGKLLNKEGHEVLVIHGDMNQFERDEVMLKFRKSISRVLVATDVAARGLDISSIKTVINFDVARDITTHTHRIGRTGRAGEHGEAYTLVTPTDINFLPDLVRNLESANQNVSDDLLELSMTNHWFKKQRNKYGKTTKMSSNNTFKPRPGLGFKYNDGNSQKPQESSSLSKSLEDGDSSNKNPSNKLSALKRSYLSEYSKFKKSEKASLPGISSNINASSNSGESSSSKKRNSRWN